MLLPYPKVRPKKYAHKTKDKPATSIASTMFVATAAATGGGKASKTEEKMILPYPKGRARKYYEKTNRDNTATPDASTMLVAAAAAADGGGGSRKAEEKMLLPYPKGRPKKYYEKTRDNTTTPYATPMAATTATTTTTTTRHTTMGGDVSIMKKVKSSYSSSKAKCKKRSKQSRIQRKLNETDETPIDVSNMLANAVTDQNTYTDTIQDVTRPTISFIMEEEKNRISYPQSRPVRYQNDGVEPIRVLQYCDEQEEKEEEQDDDISPVQVHRHSQGIESLQSSVLQPGATAVRYEDNADDDETVSEQTHQHQREAITDDDDAIPNNNTASAAAINEQDQGLVIAAEIAPNDEDIEAQVQRRVAQETENIETKVQQRMLDEAVHADVMEDDTDEKMARVKLWIGCTICFVIVLLAVVLSTTLTRDTPSPTQFPTENPTESPSINPSTTPSLPPTSNLQDLIITYSPESIDALADINSPQSKALDWLENNHTDIHNMYTKERIIQRFALATLYFSTYGDNWLNNTGWLSTNSENNGTDDSLDDECNWYGIVTDSSLRPPYNCDEHYIIGISLSFNRIEWALPLEVSLLSGLNNLDLSQNIISSTLPTEIGLMTGLETLSIQENSLSGTLVSELGLLTSLSNLQLSHNNFKGSIPSEIESLKVLSTMDLQYNGLTGSIPSQISSMTNLRSIDFSFNRLNTHIPSEIGTLTGIQSLILKRNLLNGTIPTHLAYLTSAEVLDLSNNLLEGMIPSELGQMTSLEDRLDLSFNILTGSIPEQFGSLTKLENLLLNRNLLTGSIPSGVRSLEKLENLNVGDNHLSHQYGLELYAYLAVVLPDNVALPWPNGYPDDETKLKEKDSEYYIPNSQPNIDIELDFGRDVTVSGAYIQTWYVTTIDSIRVGIASDDGGNYTDPPTLPAAGWTWYDLGSITDSINVEREITIPHVVARYVEFQIRGGHSEYEPISWAKWGLRQIQVSGTSPTFSSQPTSTPTTSSSPTTTSQPSAVPSMMPTINCDTSIVRIELTTDSYPYETSWNITEINSNLTLLKGGPYDADDDSSKLFIDEVCVLNDSCFEFTIYDSYGDGICCDVGNGEYNIYFNSELIASGGEFNYSESILFGNNCPTATTTKATIIPIPDDEPTTTLPDDDDSEPTTLPIDEPTTMPADDDEPTSMPTNKSPNL